MNKALGPLHEFTDALSADDYVTVPCLKPGLELFNSDLLQAKVDDTKLTANIESSVLEYLNSKYAEDPDVEELINLATMLDTRFQRKYMGPEETQVIKARAIREMELFLPGQSGTCGSEISEKPTQASGSDSAEAKRPKKTLGSFSKRAAAATEKTGMSEREMIQAYAQQLLAVSTCR